MPPRPVHYPLAKASKRKKAPLGAIIARAMIEEKFPNHGDYCRIIDLIQWEGNKDKKEIRFTYYYRKPNGGEKDWVYGQGAGHMTIKSFYRLLKKAKKNPDFGDFGRSLDKIKIESSV